MNAAAQGFSMNEYLIIFIAFIYGHSTTNFLSGWACWLQNRKSIAMSVDHVFLSILLFLLLIDNWWLDYSRITVVTQNLPFFLMCLMTPILSYLVATILFPAARLVENMNLTDYFLKRERLLYSLLGLNFLVNFVTSPYLEPGLPFSEENLFRVLAIGLCMFAVWINKRFVNRLLTVAGTLLLVVHMIVVAQPAAQVNFTNFSMAEYLTVFIAFIYGFVASFFLRGWALLIQRFNEISFKKEHMLLSVLGFGILVDIWWSAWEREQLLPSNLAQFILSLTTPLAFYLLASALFPIMRNGPVDLKDYFKRNEKYIYVLFAGLLLTNFIVANTMEHRSFFELENGVRMAGLCISLFAAQSSLGWIRRAMLVAGCVLFAFHSIFLS